MILTPNGMALTLFSSSDKLTSPIPDYYIRFRYNISHSVHIEIHFGFGGLNFNPKIKFIEYRDFHYVS